MKKTLIIGGDNAATEIVDTLTAIKEEIIVVDPNYSAGLEYGGKLTVINKQITDKFFKEDKNVFNGVTTAIILAGNRLVEGLDEATSLILRNKIVVEDIDANTLLKVIEVREIFKNNYPDSHVRIIAEMIESKNEELFKDVEVDDIIPTDQLFQNIMVQMIFNEGIVSELVFKLLSRNDKAYLTKQKVYRDSEYLGKTYDELLIALLEKEIQLIAIERSDERRTIINPVDSFEKKYFLQENDKLIVLKSGNEI